MNLSTFLSVGNVSARCAVALVSLFVFVSAVSPVITTAYYNAVSVDTICRTEDQTIEVLLPANWLYKEQAYKTIGGAEVFYLKLSDQADQGSRATKGGYVLRSTASGIFGLPSTITSRLDPREMVNFYLHQIIRSSMQGKVLSVKVIERNGEKVYSVEWSYVTSLNRDQIEFIVLDEFIFRGDTVYQSHGVYASFRSEIRNTIVRMVQSLKASK